MPRCLEPGHPIKIVLDSDKDKPEGSRPTFLMRALSVREWRNAIEKIDSEDVKTHVQMALVLVRAALGGWSGMVRDGQEIPFSLEELDSIVDTGEAIELFDQLVAATVLSAADKKKLELQRSSDQGNSAPVAA